MANKEMVAMLLAGGQGSRLKALTKSIAKPAVAFAGKYRIIDFLLSNCTNSGIITVGVLTQYKPYKLNSYIGNGEAWDLDINDGGVCILPPFETEQGGSWYLGTADAIYCNLGFLDGISPRYVLILSGDHLYKMDYNDMLDYHKKNNADLTHENEIAQYEAAHNETFSNYWMNNAFLNINGEKMSKSLGNFYTIREIIEKYDGDVLRLIMLSTHYRSMLNFSFELMDSAKSSYERISNSMSNIKFLLSNNIAVNKKFNSIDNIDELHSYIDFVKDNLNNENEVNNFEDICKYINIFIEKLNDDLNTADAIIQIYEIVKVSNVIVNENSSIEYLKFIYCILSRLLGILGIEVNKKDIL